MSSAKCQPFCLGLDVLISHSNQIKRTKHQDRQVVYPITLNLISIAECKTAVTPVHQQRSYYSLAQSHRYLNIPVSLTFLAPGGAGSKMRVCISLGKALYTGKMMSSGTSEPRDFMRSYNTSQAVSISSWPVRNTRISPVNGDNRYYQTSHISRTLPGNKTVDHSECSWSIACWRCSNYIFILD